MKPLSAYEHVVWDFNGTLLDDVWLGIRSVNRLLERRGLPLIASVEQYHGLFGFPIIDYYRRLGFDFEKEPYDKLAVEWVAEYRQREGDAPLRKGARELLCAIRERGLPQTVISATEHEMLFEQLTSLGILDCFESVWGRGDIFAASKTGVAAAWAQRRQPGATLMIGDTVHDMECAETAAFDCVLVAGGHQAREVLENAVVGKTGMTVVSDFEELRRLLEC